MSRFKNSIIMLLVILAVFAGKSMFAFQDHGHDGHDHSGHDHKTESHSGHSHEGTEAGHAHGEDDHGHSAHAHDAHSEVGPDGCPKPHHHEFDAGQTALHHIGDANTYSIGPFNIPLPCMLYAPAEGFSMFSSGNFESDGHGTGKYAYAGYALNHSSVIKVEDSSFPKEKVAVTILDKHTVVDGKDVYNTFVCYKGKHYPTAKKSTADGGLFGGGLTSFYDFSITKNVVAMLLVFAFLAWMFISIAKKYNRNPGEAPSGMQGLIEPVFIFIQDEVAKPFLGDKYEKHLPLLMSLFFFILGLNLFGQIPFFGNANPTGNLAFTMVLAVIAFIVTNINGNKHYWEHILWMPGVPAWVKTILTPVEVIGVFIKPVTLMLRLFANITAGHMVMVVFVSLIFIFGNGQWAPSLGSAVGATALTMFMMAIELLVAFIQAFVFTILTASYIGAAIEDHHHGDHAEAH